MAGLFSWLKIKVPRITIEHEYILVKEGEEDERRVDEAFCPSCEKTVTFPYYALMRKSLVVSIVCEACYKYHEAAYKKLKGIRVERVEAPAPETDEPG